jgi:sugar lactone lactonase YvrE
MKTRFSFLLFLLCLSLTGAPTLALSPYSTWTLGPARIFLPTQDAYTPYDEIELPVSSPEDMFLAPDGFLYIADTGNSRILRLDHDFQISAEYGAEILDTPTGLFVDEDGTLYIADAGKDAIVILDASGALIAELGRPSEPLFGANREFLPRKIAVDARRNLYIVSEGSVNGLVMMNTSGNFIGYFGANAAEMSLKMILQRMFLTDEQLEQFIRNEAASPSNIAIDQQSLIYTITAGTEAFKSIRKFNIAGKNLFDRWIFGSKTLRDLDVSSDGLLVAVDAEGRILEYDQNGTLLFFFGGLESGDQRLGLLSNPTAIERVGDFLYVLDRNKNAIVIYQVTDFARQVHDGVQLYVEGFYTEAKPYFEQVLNNNGLMVIAYQALANAYFKETSYADALSYYRYADDRSGYSEALWELRNIILQQHLASALTIFVLAWIALSIFTRLEKRYKWLDPLRQLTRKTQKIRLIDDLVFLFRFIRQPSDSFYYIRHNLRGSLRFAFLLYLWVIVARLISLYWTGFIFSPYYSTSWQIEPEIEVIYTVLPLFLWNVANYLIASISDGEGRVRDVIIGSAYSLFPYALFVLPITMISNVLTLNEIFIVNFSTQLMFAWTGLMFIIMVKEIHNYSFNETIRNILTTIFTMAMFLLTAYILYVLFNQLYEFVFAIIQEAGLRA